MSRTGKLGLANRLAGLVMLKDIYLLPKVGYDSDAAKENRVVLSERYSLEKYISSFLSIANRTSPSDVPWKYEKVGKILLTGI